MTAPEKKPYTLIPEVALLAPLPAHLRERFETALLLMHNELAEGLSWEEIATQSAISPYHFHRQFSQLLNETPGHYLSRIRLQQVVSLLFLNDGKKITDIAHQCGYSSSQALAKILKRELNITAKGLREHISTATPEETTQILAKLAHPGKERSIEAQLALSMPTELIWYPVRGIKTLTLPDYDWDRIVEIYGQASTQFLSATPVSELERPWNEISYTVGDWQAPGDQHDYFIAEGYYLCSDVHLATDTAYASALDSLFLLAEQQGYKLDESRCLIEIVREVEISPTGRVTFSFQIPIRD